MSAGSARALVVLSCPNSGGDDDGEFSPGSTFGGGATASSDTLSASNSTSWCNKDPLRITVSNIGSPLGRAGSLTNFTATMGSAVLLSGSPDAPANPLVFEIQGLGGSQRTFYLGADFPIQGDDSTQPTGLAATGFIVSMQDAKKGSGSASNSGLGLAFVLHQLTVGILSDPSTGQLMLLNFGTIVRPASGGGAVSLGAETGVRTTTGSIAALTSPAPVLGGFVVKGEGGMAISISVPSTITLNNLGPEGGALTVQTDTTAQGVAQLSGLPGGPGSYQFYVGGSFDVTNTTPSGAYQGVYTVSANYN